MVAIIGACSNDVIDDLSGTYDYINRYDFTSEKTEQTEKLKKGLKNLHMVFSTDNAATLDLYCVSRDWTLAPGTYTPTQSLGDTPKAMQYCASVTADGKTSGNFTEGNINITLIDETYFISGMVKNSAGNSYMLNYRGPISFEIGIDDPEPSGFTANITEEPLYVWDNATMGFQQIPGVSKYKVQVADPEGADAAYIELLNNPGCSNEELAGTYPIAENALEPGKICNGYYFPEYYAVGGSYIVGGDKQNQYLGAGGNVEVSFVDGITGERLLNIKGSGIAYSGPAGSGTTNVNLNFISIPQKFGTEIKDMAFHSEALGKDVKYSVLLPENYDQSKQYPVLYLLHGATGGNNDWLNGGKISSSIEKAEMVIVTPQASFDGFDSFYVDNYKGAGLNYETFFINEFMPYVEQTYHCNGKRGIAGLSMGGFGTMYYGIKYNDKFVGMYACSPALNNGESVDIGQMLFTMPNAKPYVIEIGTEDFLYQSVSWLKDMGGMLPLLTYVERPGQHDWAFWSACSPKIVEFFSEKFSE